MNKEYYDNAYNTLYVRRKDSSVSELESLLESVDSDFEKKVILVSILDDTTISPELKTLLRKYSKEITEIREVNQEFIDSKITSLPFTPGWYPDGVE